MPLIYVYGTLKRGDVRSHALEGQVFLGIACTHPLYRLVNCGEYPALVTARSSGRAIKGEVYEVTEACLHHLDDVEGVDEGLYERRPVELQRPFDQRPVEAYFYRLSTTGLPDCGDRWTRRV